MKAYKIELLVIDFDEIGIHEIVSELENANYANDCISPEFKSSKVADIGEWYNDHPLNKIETSDAEYRRLFS